MTRPSPVGHRGALLAVTLGNSTAAATLVTGDTIEAVRRTPVDRLDDLGPVLARACPDCGGEAVAIAVASVNPPALEHLERLLKEMLLPKPLVAGRDFPIPMKTDVLEPDRVGADRLLAALAAWRRAKGRCIVVDCGTAITVNSIRGDGVFLGGAILPGLALMARALAEGTALLPQVPAPETAPGVGRNTQEAMAAGILHGAAGAVANLVLVARNLIGRDAPVFLTGGDALRLAAFQPPDCRNVFPNLVLEGLAIATREWTPN